MCSDRSLSSESVSSEYLERVCRVDVQEHRCSDVDETIRLGMLIGRQLCAGDVVILDGALGAGKTTLTRGIVKGVGCQGRVLSPTFGIARRYLRDGAADNCEGACTGVLHLDLYRFLDCTEDAERGALLDSLDVFTFDQTDCVVVEWGASFAHLLGDRLVWVRLDPVADETVGVRARSAVHGEASAADTEENSVQRAYAEEDDQVRLVRWSRSFSRTG